MVDSRERRIGTSWQVRISLIGKTLRLSRARCKLLKNQRWGTVRAWNQHDSAAFDTIVAPGAIHEHSPKTFAERERKKSRTSMRDVIGVEPDFRWTVTSSIEDGKFVALEWTWTSTYTGPDPLRKKATNKHLSGRGSSFAEVENRKIKRFTDFYDQASFFR